MFIVRMKFLTGHIPTGCGYNLITSFLLGERHITTFTVLGHEVSIPKKYGFLLHLHS